MIGIGVGLLVDYAAEVIRGEESSTTTKVANGATGGAIAATQPLVDKPRGGIAGGGQAGTKTSVASKLNHAAEKSGAISTSTRNTITKGLRFLGKRLPYVGLGSSVVQLGDAIVDRIESETAEEQIPEPEPEPQREELERN